jgi:PAS domain S-box-containing protein
VPSRRGDPGERDHAGIEMTVENLILPRPEHAPPDDTFVRAFQEANRLAATYEAAGVGIVEIDAEGRLLRVNRQLCSLLGRTEHEILGKSLFDLTHPDDAITDRAQYSRQVAGEIDGYTLEKRFLHKDGNYLWASVTSRSVKDANGRFLYAVRVQ